MGIFKRFTRKNRVEYAYLDKPTSEQVIGRSYMRLNQSLYNPTQSGWENTLYYLNIKPRFMPGKDCGAIRPRVVRANGDATAYDDIVIHRDALDDDGITLKTQLYWEWAKGEPTAIELKCIGGLASIALGTRYTKKAIIP